MMRPNSAFSSAAFETVVHAAKVAATSSSLDFMAIPNDRTFNAANVLCGQRVTHEKPLRRGPIADVERFIRSAWPFASTRVSGAVLVNASTLGLWQLLEIATVVIASTTGAYAFLFGCLSRRERFKTGVARIERVNARQQKHRKEEGDGGK